MCINIYIYMLYIYTSYVRRKVSDTPPAQRTSATRNHATPLSRCMHYKSTASSLGTNRRHSHDSYERENAVWVGKRHSLQTSFIQQLHSFECESIRFPIHYTCERFGAKDGSLLLVGLTGRRWYIIGVEAMVIGCLLLGSRLVLQIMGCTPLDGCKQQGYRRLTNDDWNLVFPSLLTRS